MVPLVTAYDLTRDSGVYSDADKVKIENDLFREYKRMMVAYPPWRDLTLPFGYAGMAYAGQVLGDHGDDRLGGRGAAESQCFHGQLVPPRRLLA